MDRLQSIQQLFGDQFSVEQVVDAFVIAQKQKSENKISTEEFAKFQQAYHGINMIENTRKFWSNRLSKKRSDTELEFEKRPYVKMAFINDESEIDIIFEDGYVLSVKYMEDYGLEYNMDKLANFK